MPLVRIDSSPVHDDTTLAAFGDAVHQALVDTLGIPEDDFFQIVTRHDAGQLRYDPGYFGVSRDDATSSSRSPRTSRSTGRSATASRSTSAEPGARFRRHVAENGRP